MAVNKSRFYKFLFSLNGDGLMMIFSNNSTRSTGRSAERKALTVTETSSGPVDSGRVVIICREDQPIVSNVERKQYLIIFRFESAGRLKSQGQCKNCEGNLPHYCTKGSDTGDRVTRDESQNFSISIECQVSP